MGITATSLLLRGDVARLLGVSRTRVRHLILGGRLRVAGRTLRGVQLFDVADVEALRLERERRRQGVSTGSSTFRT